MNMQRKTFPTLESKIAEHGITKRSIAQGLEIDAITLSRKLSGKTEFTLKEIRYIHEIFPELPIENLFGISENPVNLTPTAVPFVLEPDDSKVAESLEKIEARVDKLIEKVNVLESALERCEKSVE